MAAIRATQTELRRNIQGSDALPTCKAKIILLKCFKTAFFFIGAGKSILNNFGPLKQGMMSGFLKNIYIYI